MRIRIPSLAIVLCLALASLCTLAPQCAAGACVSTPPSVLMPTATNTPLASGTTTPTATPSPFAPITPWLTTADFQTTIAPQPTLAWQPFRMGVMFPQTTVPIVIGTTRYQTLVGLGASLTGTATSLLARSPARTILMQQLFGPSGLHLSFLRQPLGSPDFSDVPFYTYEDTPGQFSLGHDLVYTIPLLQQALALNPAIQIMGTPWSPPAWMKDSNSLIGGTLLTGDQDIYANYLVQALQAYAAQGVPISYLSSQNEPGYVSDYPAADWSGQQEVTFLTQYLQPALQAAGLAPHLLGLDSVYQANTPAWNTFVQLLENAGIDVALHCYFGLPPASALPANLYETECASSISQSYASSASDPLAPEDMLIDWSNAGAKSLLFWNIAADQSFGPTPLGANVLPCVPLITIQTDASGNPTGIVTHNPEFWAMGQFSEFVQPGATRLETDLSSSVVSATSFENPDGTYALIAHNRDTIAHPLVLLWQGQMAAFSLPAGAVVTLAW